jgi:phospholipid-binding lipoprotein MlaA
MAMTPKHTRLRIRICALLAALLFFIPFATAQAASQDAETASAEEEALAFVEALDEEEPPPPQLADPLYYVNKGIFHFNDKLYLWVLKPVAVIYQSVLPRPFRTGIQNAYDNLKTPVRFASSMLQGKTDRAGVELGRFMVNTVFGGLGFWNVADLEADLQKPPEEDLGQTLGTYGIGNGIYLVWPILGPSTLRDTAGRAGDIFLDPVAHIAPGLSPFLRTYERLNWLSLNVGNYESVKAAAVDPYASFKDIYLQYRRKAVQE